MIVSPEPGKFLLPDVRDELYLVARYWCEWAWYFGMDGGDGELHPGTKVLDPISGSDATLGGKNTRNRLDLKDSQIDGEGCMGTASLLGWFLSLLGARPN